MAAVPIEGVDQSGFGMRAGLASMTAWSPNPQNPPFYVDFPLKDGAVDPLVIAKWANNSPLAMVASHLDALRSFDAIGSDVGTKDGLIRDDTLIHEELDALRHRAHLGDLRRHPHRQDRPALRRSRAAVLRRAPRANSERMRLAFPRRQ